MTECKVWLDNYHTGYYYPGNQIEGRVAITLNTETKFRNIKVRLFGHEHTSWTTVEHYKDTRTRRTATRYVQKVGNHTFHNTEIILYRPTSSNEKLPVGQHTYPFSLTLPYNIPGSYNCEYGHISYSLKAIVDRPSAFDYEDTQIFVVVTMIDLNNLRSPDLLLPTSYSKCKTLYCCCCSQGLIEMDVNLPKRTLVTDQSLNISVRLSNLSKKNVERLEIKLKQVISCRVNNPGEPSKAISNKMIHLQDIGLGAHGEHTYTLPVKLSSTSLIPNFSLCKLFKVNYYFTVLARLPGIHKNLKIKMYPELGHIDIGQQRIIENYPYPIPTVMPMPSDPFYNFGFEGEVLSTSQVNGAGSSFVSSSSRSDSKPWTPSADNPSAPVHGEELPPSYESIHPKKY